MNYLSSRITAVSYEDRDGHSTERFSWWAISGAVLAGLSLALPSFLAMSVLLGRSGIGPGEIWLALGNVLLPGLGGTIQGWLALHQIRNSRGEVSGLILALFAALTWPLLTLVAVVVGIPALLIVPGMEAGWIHLAGRILLLLLPGAALVATLWIIYATARWAAGPPVKQPPHEAHL